MTKKVRFSDDTKTFDGCSVENASFHYLIKYYLWVDERTIFFKILKMVKDDIELLEFFITETNNIIERLEELESTQLYDFLFNEEKDEETTDKDIYHSKIKKNVPIARYGSRDTNEQLTLEHKICVLKFYNILVQVRNFIKNKK